MSDVNCPNCPNWPCCPCESKADCVTALPDSGAIDKAFAEAFIGYNYGEEETADAKAWFETGWKAATDLSAVKVKALVQVLRNTAIRYSDQDYTQGRESAFDEAIERLEKLLKELP